MKETPAAILEELARSYGTDASKLAYFQGGHPWSDGVLYDYTQGSVPYILKVMEMPAADAEERLTTMKGRLEFVRSLGERGIPIVYPEPSVRGLLYAEAKGEEHAYVGYTYRKREGELLFKRPQAEHEALFVRWGRTMGEMHEAAASYPVWQRLSADPEGRLLGWEAEWRFFDGLFKDEGVRETWRKLKLRLDALPQERDSFGFTHNDLHIENLLAHEGELTVLDFDVASTHWFACDVAVALYSILIYAAHGKMEHPPVDPARLKELAAAFMQGYESVRRLDDYWRGQLNLFLEYRRMLLFAVVSPELQRHNPAHYEVWRSRIVENAPFPDWGG